MPIPAAEFGNEAPKGGPEPRRASFLAEIRGRIVSGLVFALPIAITFWIVYWLYSTFQAILLDPGARLVKRMIGQKRLDTLPFWWQQIASPLIAVLLVVVLLYVLGYFVRTRVSRAFDWLLLRVPIVTTIYKAVRSVFQSLAEQRTSGKFKRVVLIPFPSANVRSPAFVTRSMTDTASGRTILCVYVPYCPLPTTGLILMVPEDEVVDLSWDVNQTMQAVISFGISSPSEVAFRPSGPDVSSGAEGSSGTSPNASTP